MRRNLWLLTVIAVVLIAYTLSWKSRVRPPMTMPAPNEALDPKVLKAVTLAYHTDVQPLFKRACMDCHSSETVYPWYHKVPGVAQYLDRHIEHARHALDLSDGPPFNPSTPFLRHLRRISTAVSRGTMPLWDYKLMHSDARLTDAERNTIVQWADSSLNRLSTTAKAY